MNLELLKPFSDMEILTSISSMHPFKALGMDGFPTSFFQKLWSIVGDSVVDLCLNILNNEEVMDSINHTRIVLIPKMKEARNVENFRPISLCTVLYKIKAKTIANRLKPWLDSLISLEQSAFIPGRQITDNILMDFETVHKIKTTTKGKKTFMALKLDISKAYNRV